MLKNIENAAKSFPGLGLFLLRVFVGSRLIYGVVDNVFSWAHMQEFAVFLDAFGFPVPVVSAILSVYVQLLAGICILLGFRIRVASILIVVNFIVALAMVHMPSGDSIEAMTPALAMLFGSLAFVFSGAGSFALSKD